MSPPVQKQSNEIYSKGRRQFVRKTGVVATVAFLGSFTLMKPRDAHAVIMDIPAFVMSWIEKSKKWYDETGKGIQEEIEGYLDLLKGPSLLAAIAAATDAANKVKEVTTERHEQRLAQGNPSEGCAQEASSTAAEATEDSLKEALSIEASDNALNFMEGLRQTSDTMAIDFERAVADEINDHDSLQELLEGLDASDFVSNAGYIDGESGNMDLYRRVSTLMPRRALLRLGDQRNDRVLAKSMTGYSRVSVIESALDFIYARRLRSAEAFNQAHGAADAYEQDILSKLAHPAGDDGDLSLATVDLEAFEIQRTHLSSTWQDLVETNTSDVALNKEITVLASHSNMLDYRIYEVRRRINELRGIKTLAILDTPSLPSRLNETDEDQEEEEVMLFGSRG